MVFSPSIPKIKVKNLHGTSDNKSEIWKSWWELNKGRKFSICSNIACSKKAEVGGHVIKADSSDRSWYIVPLCKECNHTSNNEIMEVRLDDLVRHNNQ